MLVAIFDKIHWLSHEAAFALSEGKIIEVQDFIRQIDEITHLVMNGMPPSTCQVNLDNLKLQQPE